MGKKVIESEVKGPVMGNFDHDERNVLAGRIILEKDYAKVMHNLEKANSELSATNGLVKWIPGLGWSMWVQNNYSIKHNNEQIAETLVRFLFYKGILGKNVDFNRGVEFDAEHSLVIKDNSMKVTYYLIGSDTPVTEHYGYWTVNNKDESINDKDNENKLDYTNTRVVVYDKKNPGVQYDQRQFAEDYAFENIRLQQLLSKHKVTERVVKSPEYVMEKRHISARQRHILRFIKSKNDMIFEKEKTPIIHKHQLLMTQQ